jgi:hypothetical protein
MYIYITYIYACGVTNILVLIKRFDKAYQHTFNTLTYAHTEEINRLSYTGGGLIGVKKGMNITCTGVGQAY